MGGCPVTVSNSVGTVNSVPNILPRATTSTPPTPLWSAAFTTNPCSTGTTGCSYTWEANSPTDNTYNKAQHTGLINLNGATGWADLSQTSGPTSVSSTAFPTVGGGTAGWSFEITFKPNVLENWGKLFDIGSTRSPTAMGACVNDIVLGWDAGNNQFQFDVCDANNHEFQTGDAVGMLQTGQWYHVVAVIAPSTAVNAVANQLANYFTYINGYLYTVEANFLYPQAVTRQNPWLGRSGWYANGDLNFSAEVDTFNVYNTALTDAQVLSLATTALGSGSSSNTGTCTATPACSSSPATVPTPWYELTFASNPNAAGYGWEQQDASDNGCPYVHQGIATFTGGATSGQYIDLLASSGTNAVGSNTLPGTIGGQGAGSLSDGTMGWSFEWTMKSGTEASNGKIFAIGAGQAVWNIFAGPDGGATGATFGLYDGAGSYGNGHSGILEIINPVSTSQWYHVVAVVQQVAVSAGPLNVTHQAAYFVYINGQLLNFTGVGVYVNSLVTQAVARPNAYIARSDWSADPYWTGILDTFRIYNKALTQSQVTSRYQGEMGGCTVPTAGTISGVTSTPNILPRATTSTPPSPLWSATFTTNPCSTGTTGCTYTWEATSPSDNSANAALHTGLISLNGATQWVDLGQTSGPTSAVSTAFPQVGGGTTGWSFEITFKPNVLENWGKLFDIGSTRSPTAMGTCVNDIVLGWDASNTQFQFDVCDSAGHEFQTGDAVGMLQTGQWYHVVAVIAPATSGSTLANYFTYINGYLYTVEANFLYPILTTRQNAWLGRSGWYANGDANFSAEVDTFNVYNTALTDAQVLSLATTALGSSAVNGGSSGTSTCSAAITCPSTSATVPTPWYELTFATNPNAAGYGWEQQDAGDAGCPFVHQGIVTFSGGATSGQYIDLTASTGANAVGSNTLTKVIGGAGSGQLSDGTMGWSFEWTFRSGTEASNGKIFAIGAGQAVWNIFAGPDGGATGANFGVYDGASSYGNGHSGIVEFVNPISTSTWYHVVAVVQQISSNNATHGAYFLYVNGQLLNYNGVGIYINSLLVQPQQRPNAYIARSDWSADPYWTGIMDTFRIYDKALTGSQVTARYNGEMGGCMVNTSPNTITGISSTPNILPRATTSSAASPVFELTFSTNPCAGSTTCLYGWEQTSPSDSAANQARHTGIVTLNGVNQWIDMQATSGPNALSGVPSFPTIGGGANGYTFELIVKPGIQENWGKIIDIGSTRSATALGTCVNDIVMGWDATNTQWQFDVCDGSGHEFQTGDAFGNIAVGMWYHLVATITPTSNGMANYITYVNGQLYTAEANFLYPTSATRQNAWMGRSGWYANGDSNFSGEVDYFAIYNTALTDAQIAARAAQFIVTPTSCTAKPACSSSPATVPTAWYSTTFATNPVSGISAPTYTWQQSVSTDSTCAYQHTGLATFNGNGQYVDLSYATGANSSGYKIPGTIGGAGAGSLSDGTQGWSFEWTILSGQEQVNGKIFAIGAGQAVWNIFAGPDGGGTGANFGVYDGQGNYNNGQSGIVEWANPIYTTQWYHVVAVVQQTQSSATNLHGAYFLYVNGQQLNYTGVGIYLNALSIQAQARPNAYLAKSDWSADPYWTGSIDTFRIYDRALTQAQVTSLYQGEMGGCTVPFSSSIPSGQSTLPNLVPRTSNTQVTPFYSLTFATDPRTSTSTAYNYGWEAVSANDAAVNQSLYKGILTLNGQGQYVDLNAVSGPQSVSTTALPQIGGGTTGWTFEIVVKPGNASNWAKIMDIGSTRSVLSQCSNDIVMGWDANNAQWQFDLCDSNNHEYQTGDAFGNLVGGIWVHLVASIVPTLNGNGLANYFTYVNGQLYTVETNFLYPQPVARQNAWLGLSGWYVNGDANFSGEISTFNIYNTGVSDAQANSLYIQNFQGGNPNWGTSTTSTGTNGGTSTGGTNGGGTSNSSSGLSGGAIAGIVIGSVVGVALLLVLLFCICTGAMSRGGKKTGNTGYDSHADADQSQIRSEQHTGHEGEEGHTQDVEMA